MHRKGAKSAKDDVSLCGKMIFLGESVYIPFYSLCVTVPKYHDQTGVPLSLKNLKGCPAPAAAKRS